MSSSDARAGAFPSGGPVAFGPRRERRAVLVALALGATALATGGCGFHLRGQATYAFASIYLAATGAAAPFATELKRVLENTGSAKVVDGATGAQVILDIPFVGDEKDVLSLGGAGGVREFALTTRIQFRLHDADGLDWLPPGEIVVRRSYTFNETEVLARDAQEQRLLREMRGDAAQQMVRRLQAARKPA